jgi:hypothetical protein
MKRAAPAEETGRVLAVTLAVWAIAAGTATYEGVFTRLADPTLAALALFATVYAPAMYRLDRGIRELVLSRTLREVAGVAAAIDAALAIAYASGLAWPMLAFFGLPLAAAANLALAERIYRARRSLSSMRARSPGGSPAAT